MKLRLAVAAVTALGFAAGFALSGVGESTSPPIEDAWQILSPEQVRRDSRASLASAKRSLRWGGNEQASGSRTREESAWQLAAVADAPEPVALFRSTGAGKRDLLRLAIGDALPDGGRIESIARDHVIVVAGECRRVLQLFQPAKVEAGASCPDDTSPAN